uniref:HNH endonuclease n=1 Tax=Nitrospira cf. moscoviensis SBR1015 TaxID=96242 RepID=UPI000B3BC05B|nr:HNH endonuclease signature motif containing protein [Nitrospira cf. moscoviensis SBR1015]
MKEKQCREIVNTRSNRFCEKCGRFGVEHHHRKNRSSGGKWEPNNIAALCPPCHRWVTEHPNEAEMWGLHIRPWQDVSKIPMLMRGRWVKLSDNDSDYIYLDEGES